MRDIVSPLVGIRSPFGPRRGDPDLYLPFALTGTLDPRITFSRPSLATMYDSTGKLTYAPNNLILRSNAFSTSPWSASGVTLTSGVADPFGGTAAFTMTATGVNGGITQTYSSSTLMVHSIYIRRRTGTGIVRLYTPAAGGTNLSLTSSWIRVSTQGPALSGTGYFIVNMATIADEVDIAYAQAEAVTYQTTPGTYNATTSAAYYGPRFDYNPDTLVARGLLIEEARTNVCLRSEDFTTTWSVSNATITANSIGSPDGVATADTWTSGLTVYPSVFQTITVTNALAYTATFYAKAGTSSSIQVELRGAAGSSPDGTFDLSTGVATVAPGATGSPVVSMVSVGNGWYRCAVTKTSTSTSFIFIIGQFTSVIGNTVYLWGAQLEAGSFATSYIPTAASTVARSADSATMTGTNFSSWYNQTQGTFVVNVAPNGLAATIPVAFAASDGSTANIHQTYGISTNWDNNTVVSSVTQTSLSVAGYLQGSSSRLGFAYALNNFALVHNGASPSTDSSGSIPAVNRLDIGNRLGALSLNGHIASLAYYNTRLPNATLQSLTT